MDVTFSQNGKPAAHQVIFIQFFSHHVEDVNLLQNAEWQSRRAIEKASQLNGSEEAGSQPVPVASVRQ